MELLRSVLKRNGHAFLYFLFLGMNYLGGKKLAGVSVAFLEYEVALKPLRSLKPFSKMLKKEAK